MLSISIWILAFVVVAALLQASWKIPSPVSLIVQAACLKYFGFIPQDISDQNFDLLVMMTLPLLIAADALKLDLAELRKHVASLFSLAVLLVLASIAVGSFVLSHFTAFNAIPLAAIVMLMCMVSATDPVTVSSVFSNFEVPHDLKLLTEGESLFNDATALIVFSLALYTLKDSSALTITGVGVKSATVIAGALLVGLVSGGIGYLLLTTTKEPFIEAACLLLTAYASYTIAEHYHFSGILAVIVACLFANNEINKSYAGLNNLLDFKVAIFKEPPSTLHNMQIVHKSVDFVALFAAGALFVSIGTIFDIELTLTYWKETLVVFAVSTLMRGMFLYLFAKVSNRTSILTNLPLSWVGVLTFAGSKGALSVLMVHIVPNSFAYKHMLEQIVIGNIVLSIVVYAPALLLLFKVNQKNFEKSALGH